ncbi:MAG: hypothetical protein M0R75_15535 [Dehalococcoidia bacterium]|nr:hypothetical protein [Dehalococcoidia bacterium]
MFDQPYPSPRLPFPGTGPAPTRALTAADISNPMRWLALVPDYRNPDNVELHLRRLERAQQRGYARLIEAITQDGGGW